MTTGTQEKRKRGRPRSPLALRAGYTVRFRPQERTLLDAAAAARGERLSEFARHVLIQAARRELLGVVTTGEDSEE